MEDKQLEIREKQRESWNKFAPGWQKWDEFTMKFIKPLGDAMIASVNFKESDKVLDIATGTGEPGLSIAKIVSKGSVVATDLSEGMLKVAAQKANKKGLTNFTTRVADACELPFHNNEFDVVSCRLGFMFFPDVELAAKEVYRVLKPGGTFTTTVWQGPEKNIWVTSIMSSIKNYIDVPQPEPGGPGMFRCADENFMPQLLGDAGFEVVLQKDIKGDMVIESNEVFWNMMTEIGAPIVAAMSNADATTIENIKTDVFKILDSELGEGKKEIPSSAKLFTFTKPM
jgi:ubiquinone/menaquinone biosynthesis C-methylase UbiE